MPWIVDCIPCGYYYTNFGGADDFAAMAWTNGGNVSNGRSLIRFELSSIPTNAIVTSAMLSLYFNPSSSNGDHQSLSGPNTALLQKITSSWDEYTVTWDNQPTTTSAGEVVVPETVTNTEDRPDIDITALVQQMVADPATNHGLLFREETESFYRRMIFSSSDHVDPTNHPKLVVTYEVPNETCLTFQPGPNEGMDALVANCIPCGYYYTNFGSADDFAAVAWTNGGNISNGRSLIRFDLSAVPTYATVTSAYALAVFQSDLQQRRPPITFRAEHGLAATHHLPLERIRGDLGQPADHDQCRRGRDARDHHQHRGPAEHRHHRPGAIDGLGSGEQLRPVVPRGDRVVLSEDDLLLERSDRSSAPPETGGLLRDQPGVRGSRRARRLESSIQIPPRMNCGWRSTMQASGASRSPIPRASS